MDGLRLVEPELACQHHDVGELAVEAQAFDVRHAQLRGDMHLQPEPPCFGNGRHVGGDDGADAGLACGLQGLAHRIQVFVVQRDVERQVAPDAVAAADVADFPQVLRGEIVGRMGTHVEAADAEIDGIRPTLDGGVQALEVACRGHDLELTFHGG